MKNEMKSIDKIEHPNTQEHMQSMLDVLNDMHCDQERLIVLELVKVMIYKNIMKHTVDSDLYVI